MVKPPVLPKSIGFKVSEEEYAQLENVSGRDQTKKGRVLAKIIR
jgi:hypothetical protein